MGGGSISRETYREAGSTTYAKEMQVEPFLLGLYFNVVLVTVCQVAPTIDA